MSINVKKLLCFTISIIMVSSVMIMAFATDNSTVVNIDANGGYCDVESIETSDNYETLPSPTRLFDQNHNEVSLDGTFIQPHGEKDPDYIYYDADTKIGSDTFNKFYQKSGVKQFNNVQRTITVDISQSATKVYVYVKYNYLFTYSGEKEEKYCVVTNTYSVQSDGIPRGETPVSVCFSYFPFYQQNNTGNNDLRGFIDQFSNRSDIRNDDGISVVFNGNTDRILVNNTSDTDIRLYLVKSRPYIKETKYDNNSQQWKPITQNGHFVFKQLAADSDEILDTDNDGINEYAIDRTGKYQYLKNYEETYKPSITEIRSVAYNDGYIGQIQTNCAYSLASGEKINSVSKSYYMIVTNPLLAEDFSDKLTNLKYLYCFDGWYSEKTGGTRIDEYDQLISNADHTIYARWNHTDKCHDDDDENGVCDICCKILNPYEYNKNYIYVTAISKNVNKYSKVNMKATANLPAGYTLTWYEENTKVSNQECSNTSATFQTGEIIGDKTYTLKIVKDGVIVDETPTKEVKITMNKGFFSNLLGWFKRLFNSNVILL